MNVTPAKALDLFSEFLRQLFSPGLESTEMSSTAAPSCAAACRRSASNKLLLHSLNYYVVVGILSEIKKKKPVRTVAHMYD
jgi:hypothetical protein